MAARSPVSCERFPLMSPIRSKCVNNGSSTGGQWLFCSVFLSRAPQDFGQHLGQVLGDQARAKGLRCRAMQPDGRARRVEGRHPLSEQAEHNAGEHVAAARRRQPRARCGIDRGRPSGAATTVSGPLSSRIAPERAAAWRARVELGGAGNVAEQPRELAVMRGERHGRRAVGYCREQLGGIAGEARDRVGVEHDGGDVASAARTSVLVRSPTPMPGPIKTAFLRSSASRLASARASSASRTMMAVSCDAFTASASRGHATVTRPAPTLSAPRAPSLAAPVL